MPNWRSLYLGGSRSALLLLLAALLSCDGNPLGGDRPTVVGLSVTPGIAEVEEGSSLQLQATVRGSRNHVLSTWPVTWRSADVSLASVDAEGWVTGARVGEVAITATAEAKHAVVRVRILPRPVAAISIVPEATTLAIGDSVHLVTELRDDVGNLLTDREVRWESTDTAVVTVSAGGVARAVAPGTSTVRGRSEGRVGEATITVSPGTPAVLVVVGGDGQNGSVRTVLPDSLVVRLLDEGGYPVPGVVVAWSSTGQGSATPASSVTDRTGMARSRWTLGPTSGPQTTVASAAGIEVRFTAIAQPGAPSSLTIRGGNGQLGSIDTPLAVPLTVRALDAEGNPTPGVNVQWQVSVGGGSLSAPTSETAADGDATIRWTLGPFVGEQGVSASAVGLGSVSFTANALQSSAAETFAAAAVMPTWAELRGASVPHGAPTDIAFEWGTSPNLATFATTTVRGIGSGDTSVPVAEYIARLDPRTTYYFRLVATSFVGTARGEIRAFTTPPEPTVRIVTFGDSNTDTGFAGNDPSPKAQSYISGAPLRRGPAEPHSSLQLAGKIETRWRQIRSEPIAAVNHGIGGSSTGGSSGGGNDRIALGAPNARTAVNGVTRFEAEALGVGHPWHGGEPYNAAFPNGPLVRLNAYAPRPQDFVYVSMGTNDASFGLSAEQTLANLEWMVDRWVIGGGTPAHFILTTLAPRTNGGGHLIPSINTGIRNLASRRGIHLIDLAAYTSNDNGETWRSADLHVGDGLHYVEGVREWIAGQVVQRMNARL